MTLHKALVFIEIYLHNDPPQESNPLSVAISTFLPLMQAAAQLEEQNLVPVVQPMKEPTH